MTLKKGDEILIKGTVLSFEEGEILDLEIATSENTFFVNSEDVQVLPKKKSLFRNLWRSGLRYVQVLRVLQFH